MARYQRPPDPRDPKSELTERRPRRQDAGESIPWLWLGMGLIVTIVGVLLAMSLATYFLTREPLAVTLPTPTVLRLTAPPIPTDTPMADLPTPTPIPTLTPIPTPDLSIPPDEITVGYFAQVVNTQGIGVSVRAGPSTDNIRLLLAAEGTVLRVIGGPAEGSNFIWWEVRLHDGTEGWAAGDFLSPAPAPPDWEYRDD